MGVQCTALDNVFNLVVAYFLNIRRINGSLIMFMRQPAFIWPEKRVTWPKHNVTNLPTAQACNNMMRCAIDSVEIQIEI